jgi:organic radical activating enzyme
MNKVRISECFYSLQGEGEFTGTPSVFVRSFGCTLRCPGFGLCKGCFEVDKTNPEVKDIIEEFKKNPVKDIKDLPLVKTGCDSYPSIYPEFAELSPQKSPEELVKDVIDTIPGDSMENIHLVITGGEPLLHQKFWEEVINILNEKHYLNNVTFETNGTVKPEISSECDLFITYSISPKMACSGNSRKLAWRQEIIEQFTNGIIEGCFNGYFKFVVSNEEDVAEVEEFIDYCEADDGLHITPDMVYLMPMGGTYGEDFVKTKQLIADICLKKGYKFSDRLHLEIWGNQWAT